MQKTRAQKPEARGYFPKATLPRLLLAFLLSSFGPSDTARAAVVLDNVSGSHTVVLGDVSPLTWRATPFHTDSSPSILNSVTAKVEDFNAAGTLFLEVWSVTTGLPPGPGSAISRLTLDSSTFDTKQFSGSVPLAADENYFLVMGVDNGGGSWREEKNFQDFTVDSGTWNLLIHITNPSPADFHATLSSNDLGATWTTDGAISSPGLFVLDATPTPEPGTAFLLGLGTMFCLLRRRRR